VPICTLKSFPYLPEHCVAWAKSAFEAMFSADVAVLRSALLAVHQDSFAALTETLTPEELPRLIHNVAMCSPSAYHADVAVEWALLQFHDLFVRDIEALLATHPLDELDDQGQPFWSGSRRVPVALAFNSTDPAHSAFVRWAAVLKCKSAGWPEEDIERALVSIAEGTAPKENVPASQVDQQSELRRALKALKAADVDVVAVASALSEQQFEKDDPVLGHVDLVAAAAAIRSRSYGIRVVDKMEVQRIAGNIIPALATTTALVAGLVCLELMKVVRVGLEEGGEPRVDIFRNSFVNLALPELSFAEPVPSEVFSLGKGRYATQFSIWDQIASPSAVDELTISALQKLLWQRFGIRLESVSLGDTLLFADFMADADDRLGMTVLELAAATAEDSAVDDSDFIDDRAGASPVAAMIPTSGFIDLSVSCTDSDGEGVRVPPVRVSCVREARLNEGAREGKGVFRRLLSRAKQSAKKMLTKTK
jgi:ubiquitin-activating enzyme E1